MCILGDFSILLNVSIKQIGRFKEVFNLQSIWGDFTGVYKEMLQQPNVRKVFKEGNKMERKKSLFVFGTQWWRASHLFPRYESLWSPLPGALRLHTSDTTVDWTAVQIMISNACPLHSQKFTVHWSRICILEELVDPKTLWKFRECMMEYRQRCSRNEEIWKSAKWVLRICLLVLMHGNIGRALFYIHWGNLRI